MNIQETIQKAIEGGWKHEGTIGFENTMGDLGSTSKPKTLSHVFLDSQFWICLGKAMGWDKNWYFGCFVKKVHGGTWEWHESGDKSVFWGGTPNICPNIVLIKEGWQYQWHRFIDHLSEGNTIESFFEKL